MKTLLYFAICCFIHGAQAALPDPENLLTLLLEPGKSSEPARRKDDFDLNINRNTQIKLRYTDAKKSKSDIGFKQKTVLENIDIKDLVDDIRKF